MTDLQIAKKVTLKPITAIAEKFGINPNLLEMYGKKLPIIFTKPALCIFKNLLQSYNL